MSRLFRRTALLLLTGLLALTALAPPLAAQEVDGLLPVEQAYQVTAKVTTPGTIQLHWTIAPDYYLYRSRISAKIDDGAGTLGTLKLPDGLKEHDEYLGDIEIYHHSIDATLPYTLKDASATQLTLTVKMQGCHEVDPKICYPPYPKTLTVALPAGGANATATTGASGSSDLLATIGKNGSATLDQSSGNAAGSDALPAEQAFRFEAIATAPNTLLLRWSMPKGYYLYRDKTELRLLDADGASLGKPQWPNGVAYHDKYSGDSIVYFDQVEVPVPVTRGSADQVKLQAQFQGCLENGICYPVMTRTVDVALPPAAGGNAAATDAASASAAPANDAMSQSLLFILLLALGGGLLLNLMPCVLPVLSLKAVSLVEGREGPKVARHRALAYAAGVLLSFAVVGLAVIALRQAGMASGWGFQLQQPVFVGTLVYILLAMGLSYSGVVHFGAGLAGTGQSLTMKSGLSGDFFTGVLAVVVASPCTAPAMGAALAYAFAAPWYSALLVFLVLGLGLALPFLLIGYFPKLGAWLPKPGAWMETLKQVLAFPLYLTAAWLAWVLANQRGADGVGLLLVGAVLLALALWWGERSRHRGVPSKVLAGALLLIALAPLALIHSVPPVSAQASEGVVAFTPAKLAELRKQGTPVFVDMTADWCITCKANEHTVLDTDAFRTLLKRTGTVYMKGDWTNENPDITAFLKRWNSPGVPVYVVFGKDGKDGVKLPSVLTAGIVRNAIEKANQ
ncbi:protein-disulfide reductase DsbD family protein [Oleiagrimonas soli]|uniref:Protein-disulfide reductase n=1 Tax=Oleiagrimonas soli TaxID=1543381 RepID=A0A099D0G0_9GAMM|nr:protein-disulfide reductase DsbD [Oleiagrimonas soli]KGI78770.1 protein-disulfide reductase [Oleiagrimonas soli]MBB6184465.1 thiol:disulfide interchange protein DsbD [Oleiagrimonas soli]